jgi:hypothetical protein
MLNFHSILMLFFAKYVSVWVIKKLPEKPGERYRLRCFMVFNAIGLFDSKFVIRSVTDAFKRKRENIS